MSKVTLHMGDCMEVMKEMIQSDSIDLVVTSPPYGNLRTYNGYTFDFEGIAQELHRIIKPGGVVVWVVGDATIEGSETGTSFRQALYFMECGFRLHDTMIYKKAGFNNPSSNRYHQIFEYMFIFSKGNINIFNPIKDRKNKYDKRGGGGRRKKDVSMVYSKGGQKLDKKGLRFNVWEISNPGIKDVCHPATFPESLAGDHILSWSNPGDTVMDCFLGSGTTGKMAVKYDRNFIGIEISQEYLTIAEKRIHEAKMQPSLSEVSDA
jgi:DNA modification methylase